jgi:transcription initiation factor TFIIE subunit alpha
LSEAEGILLKTAQEMLGEEAVSVLDLLLKKKVEMTDEEIANLMGVKVNNIRKSLYSLAEHGFVTYRRTRDKETGWYIYYWKANVEQINNILLNRKRQILEKLRARLEFENSNTFYICPEDFNRFTFDEAFESQFKCPRCGSPLVYYDSSRVKDMLNQRISELEEEIKRETKASSS